MTPFRDWFARPKDPISSDPTPLSVSSQPGSESKGIPAFVGCCIVDLVQPLTEAVRGSANPLYVSGSPGEILRSAVLMTLYYFSADKRFSDREVDVSRSFFSVYDPTHAEVMAKTPLQKLGQMYRDMATSIAPEKALSVLSQILEPFGAYDRLHGSTHAEQFRNSFSAMAEALANADGRPGAEEQRRLHRFREVLAHSQGDNRPEAVPQPVEVGSSPTDEQRRPAKELYEKTFSDSLCFRKDVEALDKIIAIATERRDEGSPNPDCWQGIINQASGAANNMRSALAQLDAELKEIRTYAEGGAG